MCRKTLNKTKVPAATAALEIVIQRAGKGRSILRFTSSVETDHQHVLIMETGVLNTAICRRDQGVRCDAQQEIIPEFISLVALKDVTMQR